VNKIKKGGRRELNSRLRISANKIQIIFGN